MTQLTKEYFKQGRLGAYGVVELFDVLNILIIVLFSVTVLKGCCTSPGQTHVLYKCIFYSLLFF